MEKDWIFRGKMTSKQALALEILIYSSGIPVSNYIAKYGIIPNDGVIMTSQLGCFITVPFRPLRPSNKTKWEKGCKEISYDELVEMLEQEIKLRVCT